MVGPATGGTPEALHPSANGEEFAAINGEVTDFAIRGDCTPIKGSRCHLEAGDAGV
jgi:hypothetical protein